MKQVFNKVEPTKGNKHFIPLPSDAKHYIYHDDMSAAKLFLYQLVIDYYNVKDGHAWPSIERLSIAYGMSPETTSKHIDDLKKVGLIDFPEKGFYVPLVPLTAEDFYKQFPDAWTNYTSAINSSDERREKAKQRKADWLASRGYA